MATTDFLKVKKSFFDRTLITDPIERASVANLGRFGSFVRTRSSQSIRKRKAISEPGSPPSRHKGFINKAILFAYDAGRKSVVIGPVQFGQTGQGAKVLEEGGVQVVGVLRKGRPLVYRARPFMKPAFDAELPAALESFRNILKR